MKIHLKGPNNGLLHIRHPTPEKLLWHSYFPWYHFAYIGDGRYAWLEKVHRKAEYSSTRHMWRWVYMGLK
jgi:hypothetical protein